MKKVLSILMAFGVGAAATMSFTANAECGIKNALTGILRNGMIPSVSESCDGGSCGLSGLLSDASLSQLVERLGKEVPNLEIILDRYGVNSGSCGSCNADSSDGSACPDGNCNADANDDEACPNGNCDTDASGDEACPNGNCDTDASGDEACPDGNCGITADTETNDIMEQIKDYIENNSSWQKPTEAPAEPEAPEEAPDENANANASENAEVPDKSQSGYAIEVIRLVNEERTAAGLSALTYANAPLTNAAQKRAEEQVKVFSHTRPDGRSCFTALDDFGVSYRGAGENIAMGQRTPSEVVNAWMNSEGHRANIMNASFTQIGVGVYENGGRYYWSQMFIY